MKKQWYGVQSKRGWWNGTGWTVNPKRILWYPSWSEAKQVAEDLERPPKAPRFSRRRMVKIVKPPPCTVIGKHRENVWKHA